MTKSFPYHRLWKAAFLAGLTFLLYMRVIHGQFLWDDDDYITQNLTLRSLSGLGEIWFQPGRLSQYYPLTYTSFWFDYHFWGLNPAGYHIVNILLHVLNGLLLWRLLDELKIKNSWFIALLFALHPVHVESVAWITERKNLLSGFFYLAAALFYLKTRYLFSFLLFLAALCSKTVSSTLPVALFFILWWRDGKAPAKDHARLFLFALTAAVFCSVTVALENRHIVSAAMSELSFSPFERILIAGRAVWFYFAKLFFPHPLIFIYPRWQIDATNNVQWLYPVSFLVVMAALWGFRKRLGRGPFTAAAVFFITLLPALGFKSFFPMRFSFVADHFQYLGSIPALILMAATAERFLKNRALQKSAACAVLAAAAFLNFKHQPAFFSQEALWKDTLKKNPAAWIAHNNLGTIYMDKKMEKEAALEFEKTLLLKPDHAEAINNQGLLLLYAGKTEEALPFFEKAIELQPHMALFKLNLGTALFSLGKLDRAEANFREVIKMNFRFAEAYFNLGNIYLEKKMPEEAEGQFRQAVRFNPEFADAWAHLGYCAAQAGRTDEAIAHYRKAVRLDPKHANAHNNLANALGSKNASFEEINAHYRAAIALDPSSKTFRENYGKFLENQKKAENPSA